MGALIGWPRLPTWERYSLYAPGDLKRCFQNYCSRHPKTFDLKTLHSSPTKARGSHWWVSKTKAPVSSFLYQLTVVLLFVGDPGTPHKHGGKSLRGEQALEKFNIALVGRSPFPFSVALIGCSCYAMWPRAGQVSCWGDSNPGHPGCHVSLGHLCKGSICHSQMRPMHSSLGFV